MNGSRFIGFLFLLAIPSFAAEPDLCAASSSTADVKLSLALKDGQSIFQQGEIIPLNLTFNSTAKGRYWADVRNYDRSGLNNVTPEMRVAREEIFGPVLSVMHVDTLEQAIAIVNSDPRGNGTSIFTEHGAAGREYSRRID